MKNTKEIIESLIQHSGWEKVKSVIPYSVECLKEEKEKDPRLTLIHFSLFECSTGFIESEGSLIEVNSKFRRLLQENGIVNYSREDAGDWLMEIVKLILEREEKGADEKA